MNPSATNVVASALRAYALVGALLLPAAMAQPAPATLHVLVVAEDGRPLAGAQVAVAGHGGVTDAEGRARIAGIEPGEHAVEVRRLGFEAARVSRKFAPGAAATLRVVLGEQPLALGEVEVEAERTDDWATRGGFYARRARGAGAFFTGDELRAKAVRTLSEALVGVRGVYVAPNGSQRTIVSNRGGAAGDACPLVVFVDGVATGITDIDDVPL